MALKKTFPAPTGVAISSVDSRADLSGLVVRSTAGVPRAGVLPRSASSLVSARASMGVDVAAFEAVLVRSNLPAWIQNDGTTIVPLDPAPGANKRKDLVWVRQNESQAPFGDADDLPVFGFTKGVASATPSPDYASVPAGALVLAEVEIPSTATTTQSANVVITQVFPFTTLTGGELWVRKDDDLPAAASHPNLRALALDTRTQYVSNGTAWVATGATSLLATRTATTPPLNAAAFVDLSATANWSGVGYSNGWTVPATGLYLVSWEFDATGAFAAGVTIDKATSVAITDLNVHASSDVVNGVAAASAAGVLSLTEGQVLRLFAIAGTGTPALRANLGRFVLTLIG